MPQNANLKDQLTAYNGTPITYDAIGNPLSDGTWTNIWQHGRQLAQTSKDGETVSFVYNEDGLRVQKISTTTGTTKYTLHGKNIVHLTNGQDEMHFFYDAQGKVAVVEYNGTSYRYVHNLQGDVVALVDGNGDKVVEYWYDAWGKPTVKTGSLAETLGTVQPFRYRGYVWDEETGLYYLRSRYYRPEWVRFLNTDEILYRSAYVYCDNNPIMNCDPSGNIYLAIELYTIALSVENESKYDFSNTLLSYKMTTRLRSSKVFRNRVAEYIRSIPEGQTSFSMTEKIYWGAKDSVEHLSMPDFDYALSIGHATSVTVTVEKVQKGFLESIFYWGDKYKVTYTIKDRYDFDKWEGSKRPAGEIWLNDEFGYKPQEEGIIHNYEYTITDSYYVYAY